MQILLSFIIHMKVKKIYSLYLVMVFFYKNLQISNFNLFPQKNFIWNDDLGIFKNVSNPIPYSYYGFSAFINNTNHIGLLCHFTKEEVRYNLSKLQFADWTNIN